MTHGDLELDLALWHSNGSANSCINNGHVVLEEEFVAVLMQKGLDEYPTMALLAIGHRAH